MGIEVAAVGQLCGYKSEEDKGSISFMLQLG